MDLEETEGQGVLRSGDSRPARGLSLRRPDPRTAEPLLAGRLCAEGGFQELFGQCSSRAVWMEMDEGLE